MGLVSGRCHFVSLSEGSPLRAGATVNIPRITRHETAIVYSAETQRHLQPLAYSHLEQLMLSVLK